MYRHNRKVKLKRDKHVFWIAIIVVSIVILVVWLLIHDDINNSAETTKAAPIISDVAGTSDERRLVINEASFSFSVPDDWKQKARETKPYNFWRWEATKKNADARSLELYVDTIPENLAINRLLPVSANENRLLLGTVSDNCTTFTEPKSKGSKENVMSRWQKVNFLCDMGNYSRNVIGTGSEGALNRTQVTGVEGAKHNYFFVYTDHTSRPDDSIFEDMLKTFEAK
jgi:hypothetical protein